MRNRAAAFLLLLALSGCSGHVSGVLRNGQPGLDVAEAALRAGTPQIALQTTETELAKSPGNTDALLIHADALTALGRLEEASEEYESVVRREPGSVRGLVGLGRIRLTTDPPRAETLFLDALTHDPRNTIALTDLGIARDLQGRHGDAQSAYRRALGVDPDLHAAQANLALSMAMGGDGPGALRLIRPLAEAPNATRKLRHDYAAVLAMSGNRSEAEHILSADLSPAETRQALDAYAGRSATASLLPDALPAAPATADAIRVQLSVAPSEDAANAEWQRLQAKLPEVMGGRLPLIERGEREGKSFWRLRTGGFHSPTEARDFCATVRSAGGSCLVGGA
jgi:Flp pilus assembly protein TadD